MPRRAVLSGSGQGWAEFWRDLWCGLLRGVRAAEFRDAGGDNERDSYADGGGGEATLDTVVVKPGVRSRHLTSCKAPANGLAALGRGRECTAGATRTIHAGGP